MTFEIRRIRPRSTVEPNPALLRVTMTKKKSLGIPSFNITVNRHGAGDVISATFEPFMRSLKCSRIKATSDEGSVERYRDKELVSAMIEAFYLKPARHNQEDAATGLTHHLALASGINAKTVSQVWVNEDPGYVDEAHRIIKNLPEILNAILGKSKVLAYSG